MAAPSFDSAGAVRFDLPHGAVHAARDDEPLVLVPSSALDVLRRSAPIDVLESFGRALGAAVGRRAAARITSLGTASVEEFVTQVGGEAALAGAGLVEIERWGRALVVVLRESVLPLVMIAPFVAGAIEAAAGRAAGAVLLSGDERPVRVLVAGERGAARAREWVESGSSWGDVLARLNGGHA